MAYQAEGARAGTCSAEVLAASPIDAAKRAMRVAGNDGRAVPDQTLVAPPSPGSAARQPTWTSPAAPEGTDSLLRKQIVRNSPKTKTRRSAGLTPVSVVGAGEGIRTLDPLLGKQMLYP